MSFKFDVGLSYVNAQQALAARLSCALRARGLQVFFDRDDVEAIVGRDARQVLSDIYVSQVRVCVLLLSAAYDASPWTLIERTAVLIVARATARCFLCQS